MRYLSEFLMLILIILSFSCRKKINTFKPIENIKIGISKQGLYEELNKYKISKVIDSSQVISINNMNVEVSFLFCPDCFSEKLEGIKFKTENKQKLFSYLSDSVFKQNTDLRVEKLLLKDIIEDTVVCVYSNRIKYFSEFRVIGCKRLNTDPCWK